MKVKGLKKVYYANFISKYTWNIYQKLNIYKERITETHMPFW